MRLPEKVLILGVTVVLFLLALEMAVRCAGRAETVYPLVYYNTEDPAVTLWCYDEHARTVPDWDLLDGCAADHLARALGHDQSP